MVQFTAAVYSTPLRLASSRRNIAATGQGGRSLCQCRRGGSPRCQRRRPQREVLRIDVGPGEDGAFWLAFLTSHNAGGLSGVELIVTDTH